MSMNADRTGRRRSPALAAIVIAATACLVFTGCAPGTSPSPDSASTSSPGSTASASARPASCDSSADGPAFAVVGDSITHAESPDFAAGEIDPVSWVTYVCEEGFAFAGGWAEWGATTAAMAESVTPVDAETLVLLAGTNDYALAVPFAETTANLDRIVQTVGIADVVVVSVPPMAAYPEGALELNQCLEELASARGWRFVDASAGLRDADGRYQDGMTSDGIHPSEEGSRVLGEAIAEALRDG
ncbi:SGNH/GDSL hydrolase family protein [Agromyces sp. H66]|uniref:SGNH/GDSL hydrolase family protein n=1 Tax=Agromyces sp. H66 TaxID=2529859 RepID=UPI00145B4466|nr:SGNH/GDSL hydrolase family protein [Agromyces sp. H66]